jgi:hypothetical protein
VSSAGIAIDPERTRAIVDFPPPRDVKGIARFISMVNFYKFIPRMTDIAALLNSLRKKGVKFEWGQFQQEAFDQLKQSISQPPVLCMADFSKPLVLQTDASGQALTAVLLQEVEGGRKAVAYASRTLSAQEMKASAYELECLAVVFALDKFRQYLEHQEFILETDNQALSWLLNYPRQVGKIGRWIVKISSFKSCIQDITGTQNVVADALSRMFEECPETKEEAPCYNVLTKLPLVFEDLAVVQRLDPELSQIIEKLEAGNNCPPYSLHKRMLHCRYRSDRELKVVVPTAAVPMVFEYFHNPVFGGHLRVFKTINKTHAHFIWKGMDNDIRTRVRACRTCALSKPAQTSKLGFLSSVIAQRPLQKIFDHVDKFPRTKLGNTSLVCADAFSKFVWLIPVRETTTTATIRL